MQAMGSVGTLFAIIHRISTAVGQVDWHLYRKAASGREEDRVEITSHAALDLWWQPNQFYTNNEFCETFQQHMDLTGEAWWVMELSGGDRGFPLSMWPIRPDKMMPVPDPENFLSGYAYTGPSGEVVPLSRTQVIQLKLPNPLDPYRGMGPVQALLVDLDATRYAAEWNRNFFLNSATPGGVIEMEGRLTDDQFREWGLRWTEQHSGVAQAHRVALLEGGAKWVERTYSMQDMQFAELRSISRDTIMEAFGLGRPMLGITEDVNRANADAAEYVFSKYITTSRLERIKIKLNTALLPMYGAAGAGLEFDFDTPVAEDVEAKNATLTAQAQAALNLVNAGYDPAEVAEAVGLPEMSYVGKPAAPTSPAGLPAPDMRISTAREHRARPTAHVSPNPREQDTAAPEDVDLRHVEDALDAALAKLLSQWASVQRAQVADLVEQVRRIVADGDLSRLVDMRADTKAGQAVLRAAASAIGDVGAQQMAHELNQQLPSAPVEPREPDTGRLDLLVETTTDMLGAGLALSATRSALSNFSPDLDADEVVSAVEADLVDLTDAQAKDALGGALTKSMNFGRLGTLKEAPDAAIYASEVLDQNTCKPCASIDGTWLGNTDGADFEMIDKTYPNGQFVGCQGGARCRGTVVGVLRPDQTGDE